MKTYILNHRASVGVWGGALAVRSDGSVDRPIDIALPATLQADRQWYGDGPCTVKILEVLPGQRLSDQRHRDRAEHWTILTDGAEIQIETGNEPPMILHPRIGQEIRVPVGAWHRLGARSDAPAPIRVLEISTGKFSEEDIERRSDDYGRE